MPVSFQPVPTVVVPSASRNGQPKASAASAKQPIDWPPTTEWLAEQSDRLETTSPLEIIAWAVEQFYPQLTMATAFGPEGCAIIHWLAQVEPRTPVFNLDTGYQFKETLELRDRIAQRYGIVVELKQPELTVAEYEAQHGGPVYKTNPD